MKPLTAVVKHEKAVYPYMPLEKRKKILPKRNACSLYPATQQNDAMITGNGTLRAEIYGDPFEETIVYGHELLYVPIRKNAPELPDMVGILPEVRRLLKEGEYDKASDAMREYWEKQGFGLNLYVTPDQRVIPMTTLGKVRAFKLKIESEKHEFNNYLRSLDLLINRRGYGSFYRSKRRMDPQNRSVI